MCVYEAFFPPFIQEIHCKNMATGSWVEDDLQETCIHPQEIIKSLLYMARPVLTYSSTSIVSSAAAALYRDKESGLFKY